jgi:hypothetical protein
MLRFVGRAACLRGRSGAVATRLSSDCSIPHARLYRGTDRLTIRTQEEMEAVGARLAQRRQPGDVIFLDGYTALAQA